MLLNEGQLFVAAPALDLLFPQDGVVDLLKCLKPDEARAAVGFAEAGVRAVFVLPHSPRQAVGDAAIEDAGATCHEVDIEPVLAHWGECSMPLRR